MPLEGKNLSFRYGRNDWLFTNLHLTVQPGEVVGIVGASGCGKTTLGRVLAGLEQSDEGSVTLSGKPLPDKGYRPVQMIFQHPEKAVNPRWSIRRILSEGWHPDQVLLQQLGIEQDWLSRWPNELSGGELQRICIARALAPDTRFVIADEMTTMLDAITQAQIWQAVLRVVSARRMGLVVISHDSHLTARICNRILMWEELSE